MRRLSVLPFELRDEGEENSLVSCYHFDKPALIKDLVTFFVH